MNFSNTTTIRDEQIALSHFDEADGLVVEDLDVKSVVTRKKPLTSRYDLRKLLGLS